MMARIVPIADAYQAELLQTLADDAPAFRRILARLLEER